LPRRTMVAATDQYAVALREHVDHEERVLLPLLGEYFVPEDWNEIARAVAPGIGRGDAARVAGYFRRLLASIADRTACGCTTSAEGFKQSRRLQELRPEVRS